LHQSLKYLLQVCTWVCHSFFPPLKGVAGIFLFGSVGMLPNVYAESVDTTNNQESSAQVFTPYTVLTAEVFSNVSGGLETGTSVFGLLEVGVDADLIVSPEHLNVQEQVA